MKYLNKISLILLIAYSSYAIGPKDLRSFVTSDNKKFEVEYQYVESSELAKLQILTFINSAVFENVILGLKAIKEQKIDMLFGQLDNQKLANLLFAADYLGIKALRARCIDLFSERVIKYQTVEEALAFNNLLEAAKVTELSRKEILQPYFFLLQTVNNHSDRVRSLSMSLFTNIVVSSSNDGTLGIFKRDSIGRLMLFQKLDGYADGVYSARLSLDGQKLIFLGLGSSSIFISKINPMGNWGATEEIPTGHIKTGAFGALDPIVNSVTYLPDGSIASCSDDKTIKIFKPDLSGNFSLSQTINAHVVGVYSIAANSDGSMLASGTHNGAIKLWQKDFMGNYQEAQTLGGHHKGITALAFSPDNSMLVSASVDNSVKIWKRSFLGTYSLGQTLKSHLFDVYSLAISPDGKTIVTGSYDKTTRVWVKDEETGEFYESQILTGHSANVGSVIFSPDGNSIISGSSDNTIKVYIKLY